MKFRTLAVLAATVTALSGLAVAAPATAAPAPQLSLYTNSITVHTKNGQSWKFSLSANQFGQPTSQLSLNLVRTVTAGTESHNWSMPVPMSVLSFNQTTQRGALRTPSSTAPLTTVNMSFKATSHHNLSCQSGSETDYAGNLSGQATLITHFKAGGTVGGRHLAFKTGTTHLFVDNNCVNSFPIINICSKSVFFDDSAAHHRFLSGFSGGSSRSIEVSHNVAIAQPAGTTRTDAASARPSSAPSFSKATKTLKVFGSTSGLVTGSGRIVAKSLSHSSHSCKLSGRTHTQDQYLSSGAHFTNTTGHPIVGHTSLSGRLTVANGGSAFFDYETWH